MDSKTIFALRKEALQLTNPDKLNKLLEACRIADALHQESPYDEWIEKAYCWVLIELAKVYIVQDLNKASKCLGKLENLFPSDEIICNQIDYLRPKIDIHYKKIAAATQRSKTGEYREAVSDFEKLMKDGHLSTLHHEEYGWAIYRCISKETDRLTSVQVRTLLRDYMSLKNPTPSMLHSQILNFVIRYVGTHRDLNFYKFLKLWEPQNLRQEDKEQQYYEGKNRPSLVAKICRHLIDFDYKIEIDYLADNLGDQATVINYLRESFFWRIYSANKENRKNDLWNDFDRYVNLLGCYEGSEWHSKILSLAVSYMKEQEEYRFYDFFQKWNWKNFRADDWKETTKDEMTFKPLAVKSLKKAFGIIKENKDRNFDSSELIKGYEKATEVFKKDEWLHREKGLLYLRRNDLDNAVNTYKALALVLGDKYYVWNEFSDCFPEDSELKIGMLSKALQLEQNEDFLNPVRLKLAKSLVAQNKVLEAAIELDLYRRNKEKNGKSVSGDYKTLAARVSEIKVTEQDNKVLYRDYSQRAEEYAYADLEWVEVTMFNSWKDDKNRLRYNFSDGQSINLSVNAARFQEIKKARLGDIFKFKLKAEPKKELFIRRRRTRFGVSKKEIKYNYTPLVARKSEQERWSLFEDDVAVVDYINKEKQILHCITTDGKETFHFDKNKEYRIGDFLKCRKLSTVAKEKRKTFIADVKRIDYAKGISAFPQYVAFVDNINPQKKLFHFIVNEVIQGVVFFNETNLRPQIGDFLEITLIEKVNKKQAKINYKPIEIKSTNEVPTDLIGSDFGKLKLKKKGQNSDFSNTTLNSKDADFGFVNDIYIPKHILKQIDTDDDSNVKIDYLSLGDKSKAIKIKAIS